MDIFSYDTRNNQRDVVKYRGHSWDWVRELYLKAFEKFFEFFWLKTATTLFRRNRASVFSIAFILVKLLVFL